MSPYTQMINQLATELAAGLAADYPNLEVFKMAFRASNIPDFQRYGIVVSPAARPLEEKVVGVRNVQYVCRADIYLLVKNFSETDSLFGTATSGFGLFEMIEDVKDLIRLTTLGGLLDKTYAEAAGDPTQGGGGPVEFEDSAAAGFDSGGKSFVRRARLPFVGRMIPFCHAKV